MSRFTKRNAARAAALALSVASLGTVAATASASTTHGTVTAITHISGRPDGGGGPSPWATDKFTRTLTVTYLGKGGPAATPYQYMASVADAGTFLNLPGQLTPNQGGHDAGKVMGARQVGGPMTGFGQWGVFDASAKDARGLVPTQLRGAINALYPSSTWPELAFPAGTTFENVNEANFGYGYTVPAVTTYTVKTVNGHKVTVKHTAKAQAWSDTALNGDGQLARDGNITGR